MVSRSVQQGSQSDLKAVLRSLDSESCPHHYNFHMHTLYSDGKLHPEALIEQAITIGLKGLAITDHHTINGYQAAQKWLETYQDAEDNQSLPNLWSGVEINAQLLDVEVHILGYCFDPLDEEMQVYFQRTATSGEAYQAAQVISTIQQAGGVAVLAHPARYKRSLFELIPAAAELGIDGIETYYCYSNTDPWRPSPEPTLQVHQLGTTHGLWHTCGTDTHGLNLLRRL